MNEITHLVRLFRLPNGMAIACYPYQGSYDAFSFGKRACLTLKANRDRAEIIIDTCPIPIEDAMNFAQQFMHLGKVQIIPGCDEEMQVHVVLHHTLRHLVDEKIHFALPEGGDHVFCQSK
ncbi:MAG: hypothetical protein UZ21_OP11001000795 [Microgenomates bacterium OLB22]|nr:MAG: hypothetical protein UZ21_OP11001000795 [Microgenomates bacterium OLB22]